MHKMKKRVPLSRANRNLSWGVYAYPAHDNIRPSSRSDYQDVLYREFPGMSAKEWTCSAIEVITQIPWAAVVVWHSTYITIECYQRSFVMQRQGCRRICCRAACQSRESFPFCSDENFQPCISGRGLIQSALLGIITCSFYYLISDPFVCICSTLRLSCTRPESALRSSLQRSSLRSPIIRYLPYTNHTCQLTLVTLFSHTSFFFRSVTAACGKLPSRRSEDICYT